MKITQTATRYILSLVLCTWLLSPAIAAEPQLKLPAIISDHMLLQRNTPCPIWGQSQPNQTVTVTIDNQTHTTIANAQGQWQVTLSPLTTKGPFTLTVTTPEQTLTVTDIITGDVWLASGQSNMEWQLQNTNNAKNEIATANYPDIRIFTVTKQVKHEYTFDCEGHWESVTPASIPDFSAVAYLYGRELHQQLNLPIGLIHTSWGGTPAQSWTPYEALQANPITKTYTDEYEKNLDTLIEKEKQYHIERERWANEYTDSITNVTDNQGTKQNYHTTSFNDSTWQPCSLPILYKDIDASKDLNGILWLRSTITLPSDFQNKPLTLSLGTIDDYDMTYVNGQLVGQIGQDTPSAYIKPRRYTIPASLTKQSKLTIAIRIADGGWRGGFTSKPTELYLSNSQTKISLANDNWKYKLGKTFGAQPLMPHGCPSHSHSISGLYHGMIQPLVPFAIKGAIWYQGEANAYDHQRYTTLLSTMINAWRDKWNQPKHDFPFYIVQIANFYAPSKNYDDQGWPHLRDAQRRVSQTVPNTALAVTIDVGEAKDIHPRNKQDVAKRLAYLALSQTYNKPLTPSGPIYQSHTINPDHSVTLTFKYNQNLKPTTGNTLHGFFIAGPDHKFLTTKATINPDNTITVYHPDITNPQSVRYAWANNPDYPLLTNDTNIPASPFRTDDWK